MGRAADEAKALRRQTAEFVVTDPTAIAITRTGRVSDGAGGWIEDAELTLDPQVVKIQPLSAMSSREVTGTAGAMIKTTHQVLGMFDLDIQIDDEFMWNGSKWDVRFLDESQEYRMTAEVVLRE